MPSYSGRPLPDLLASTPDATPNALGRPLTTPLLVRGVADNRLLIAVLIVATGFTGMSVVAIPQSRPGDPAGFIFLVIAAVLAVPALVTAAVKWCFRRWLEVTATGFILTDHRTKLSFTDDQVTGLASTSRVASSGLLQRCVTLQILAGDEPETVRCTYTVHPTVPDPLGSFCERLRVNLARRTMAGLAGGSDLRGKGWHLDSAGLHTSASRPPVPLGRITFAHVAEKMLRLWRDQEAEPFLHIPADSLNALVLQAIIAERIKEQPAQERALPGQRLGRTLINRRCPDARIGRLLLLAGLVMALALLAMLRAPKGEIEPRGLVSFIIIISVCGFFGLLLCWRAWRMRISIHENGVSKPSPGGTRELLYTEIGTMIWKAGPQIILEPLPDLDRPRIRYASLLYKPDQGIEQLRDRVAVEIATRWGQEVAKGPVTWTPRLRFLPGGLEYRTPGLLGGGEPVTAPYPMVAFRIENHLLLIYVSGQTRPVCKERLDLPNLLAGLVLLQWIQAYQQQVARPAVDTTRAPQVGLGPRNEERITGLEGGQGITPES